MCAHLIAEDVVHSITGEHHANVEITQRGDLRGRHARAGLFLLLHGNAPCMRHKRTSEGYKRTLTSGSAVMSRHGSLWVMSPVHGPNRGTILRFFTRRAWDNAAAPAQATDNAPRALEHASQSL